MRIHPVLTYIGYLEHVTDVDDEGSLDGRDRDPAAVPLDLKARDAVPLVHDAETCGVGVRRQSDGHQGLGARRIVVQLQHPVAIPLRVELRALEFGYVHPDPFHDALQ